MKVLGIVGSPRKGGNTYELVKYAVDKIKLAGFNTEIIELVGRKIQPSRACGACQKNKRCSIEDDLWELFEGMLSANGILIGSPVYTGTTPGVLKALLERTSWLCHTTGHSFERKVGAPIVVGARAGQNFTHAELLMWFHIRGFTWWAQATGTLDSAGKEVTLERTSWLTGTWIV